MKKTIIAVLALILILSLSLLPASASGKGLLSITDAEGKQGETVTVAVNLSNNPGLITMKFAVNYPSDLELQSVQNTGLLGGWTTPSPLIQSPYIVRWADSLSQTNTTVNGSIVTLTFKIKENATPGDKTISLDFKESWNTSGERNSFTTASATIKVNCSAHNYENDICTVCGQTDPDSIKKFDIDVARMVLGNALEFQFGVDKAKISDLTDYYAVIEKEWADGTVTTKTIPSSQWTSAGQYWAVTYDGLAAKEMSDNFYVTIYNSKGHVSEPYIASVRAYAMSKLNSNNDMAFNTMLVDMLCYGAAAQKNFSYNTGDLANNQLTAEQLSWGGQTNPMENKQVKGEFYQGTRLILESRIQMQVAFSGLKSGMYAVYTYTNHYGNAVTQRVEFEDMIAVGNGIYGISLDQLVVADARQVVTVIVYTADGQVYGGAVDSIESYCQRSSIFMPLSLDMMRFADSAYVYFHSN